MPRFKDIPQFPHSNYKCNIPWRHLEKHIQSQQENIPAGMGVLDLEPDFQRAHVWTQAQQSRYIEYVLQGGQSGRDIYFNCPGWGRDYRGPYVIVDGKQRLQAIRLFMADQVPAFGYTLSQYEDKFSWSQADIVWHVAALDTRADVLRWYLSINSFGTPHTTEEIERVRALLVEEMVRNRST